MLGASSATGHDRPRLARNSSGSTPNPRRPTMKQPGPFSERTERLVLAIISVDLFLQGAETLPALADFTRLFHWSGVGVWLAFTVEWYLRIRRAENWRKYAFSFIGVVDFLAILPLWLLTGFDLKALRTFRLLRLLRSTAKLAAHSNAMARLARAFRFAKDQAGALFTGTAVLVVTAGLGMYHLEHAAQPEVFGSVLDGLWVVGCHCDGGGVWRHLSHNRWRNDPGDGRDVRRNRSHRRRVWNHGGCTPGGQCERGTGVATSTQTRRWYLHPGSCNAGGYAHGLMI